MIRLRAGLLLLWLLNKLSTLFKARARSSAFTSGKDIKLITIVPVFFFKKLSFQILRIKYRK